MLKIQSDRVIIDGHEPTKEQCETMTLLANALAESNNFKTVEYRDGYAEFEKVGKAGELKFAEEGTEIVVNSTTLETTLHTAGKYCAKNILVKSSDSNLIAENIKKDVSVFGVTGSYSGTDVSDTTATQGDVLSGKYFYGSDGVKTEGTMTNHTETSITLNAGTGDQYVPAGHYSDILTKLVLNSDAASKIKQGEVILGVTGSYAGSGAALAHTATFTVDGSNYAIHSVTDGQPIVSPISPSKTGYAFKGWQDSNGNTISFPYTMSASEETLTADFLHLKLATPQNVSVSGTTVSWDAVENATSYEIFIGGSSFGTVSTTSVDLSTLSGWASLTDGNYSVTVIAKADGYADSEPSAAVSVTKEPQGYTITINNIGDYGTYQIIRGSETENYDVGANKGSHTYNNVTAIGIQPYATCTISNGTGNFVNGNIYGLLEFTEDSTATLTWVD